jgi:hypothetical protein
MRPRRETALRTRATRRPAHAMPRPTAAQAGRTFSCVPNTIAKVLQPIESAPLRIARAAADRAAAARDRLNQSVSDDVGDS